MGLKRAAELFLELQFFDDFSATEVIALAQLAAKAKDRNAQVYTAGGKKRTGPVWAGNRIWDPGD